MNTSDPDVPGLIHPTPAPGSASAPAAEAAAATPPAAAPWLAPEWREAVDAWIAEQVDALGMRLDGPIAMPHQRPWSTVLRLPVQPAEDDAIPAASAADGPPALYFKAVLPALRSEISLTEALGRWHPESNLVPLALDRDRGWMLLPDGGDTLRQRLIAQAGVARGDAVQGDAAQVGVAQAGAAQADVALWRDALWSYAKLQLKLVPQAAELLAMGVFDRRLAVLPGQFSRLLEDEDALLVGRPKGLTVEELAQLRSLPGRVAAMAEQLAAFGIPESLDQSDFHDGNIFAGPEGIRFFDWGDACLTHPFFSLVVGLRSIASQLDLQKNGPEMAALRLVYLEPWSRYAPRRRLQSAADLAGRLGTVVRALNWQGVLQCLPDSPERAAEAPAVPGWLRKFLATETRRPEKSGRGRGRAAAAKAARARKTPMAGGQISPKADSASLADPARRAGRPAAIERGNRTPKWRPVVRGAMRATAADEVDSRHPELLASFDYRWEHVKAVVRLALVLARLEGADPEVVEAAAWLHDVRKATGAEHGAEGAAFARTLLPATDFPAEKIEAVAIAIADHVGLWRDSQLERLESRVLWDADKLTKLGLTSALHYTASALAGSKTRSSANLLARGRSGNWMARTVASMQTEPGRRAARRRLDAYRGFWDALDDELSGSDLV